MDEIRHQVNQARRRLVVQQFLGIASWSIFAALLVAVVGLAIPKIWPLAGIDATRWTWSWIGGSVAVGFVVAILWTYLIRSQAVDAAMEIDRRFGLKERVASAITLEKSDLESPAGAALMQDTLRSVQRLDVRDKFQISTGWRPLFPLAAAMAVFALTMFVPDAVLDTSNQANASNAEVESIRKSTAQLKKRIAERRRRAEQKGLTDATDLFKKFEEGIEDHLKSNNADRKKTLIKLNDLAKDLEKRRQALGGAKKMQKQMQGLKNLNRGPADKIAKAMKEGDFKQAVKEIRSLQQKLKSESLTEAEKKQLVEQMSQLEKKMKEMVDAHEQAKEDLKRRIREKKKAGDQVGAGELEQQLERLKQQDKQMDLVEKMAAKMGECKKCMANGEQANAASELGKLAEDLDSLQEQLDELETLDDVMDQIAMAKGDMFDADMSDMQGFGNGMGRGQGMGDGLGEGQVRGDRPEERTNTGAYDSQVRDKPRPGEAVRVGDADGKNIAGRAQEGSKAPITMSLSADADPLADKRLPKSQREHARQYFDKLRDGEE